MYYVVFGLLYIFSLLPLFILHFIGDIFYFFIYYVFGYRKKVVIQNLKTAFPEKSEKEINAITRKFYHNLVDTFMETIKCISAGKRFITKHCSYDAHVLNALHHKGASCQVHMGHNFNWELANLTVGYQSPFKFLGVYMPVKNKVVDRLFIYIRGKSGTVLLPATDMRKSMWPYKNTQYMLGLIADQVPGNVEKAYWLNFFGKATPFSTGPEKGARAGNIPVIFCSVTRRKRGYYHVNLELFTENPAGFPEGELTRNYILFLERVIRQHPDMWLWSHRRWKRAWNPAYKHRWIDNDPAPAN